MIEGCPEVYDVRRAQEWTDALTRWCEGQPDMVALTGRCLVHRAEIMQLDGAWPEALEEARRAAERAHAGHEPAAAGEALYREGEVHRLRGEFAAAEEAYREASRHGWEPHPGLALLRLAQGTGTPRRLAIRRALGETTELARRAGLLPDVEIMLAAGDSTQARSACRELERDLGGTTALMLRAMVGQARGAVDLAAATRAPRWCSLRRAGQAWQELEAPYEAARARVLVGSACRALGDEDAAALELDAARGAFAELGAAPTSPGSTRSLPPRRATAPRADGARARGAAPGRGRRSNRRDRRRAGHQRAHGRPPRAEHLRQARRLVARGRDGVRLRARPGLTRAWSEMTTSAGPPSLVIPGEAAAPPSVVVRVRIGTTRREA